MRELPTRAVSALPVGTTLNRFLRCHVASRGDSFAAQLMAENYRDTPQVRMAFDELMTKGATAPGTTTDTAWAQPLTTSGIAAEAIALLRDVSIVTQVAGKARRVPFGMKRPGRRDDGDNRRLDRRRRADTGRPVPVSCRPATAQYKAGRDHRALSRIGPLPGIGRRNDDPTFGCSAPLRRRSMSLPDRPTRAAAPGRPASITNGATAITSTGTTAAAIQADLAAMVAAITTAGGGLTWIMRRKTAATIGGALGAASGLPGNLSGVPIVLSDNSPAQITLVDMAAILYADDGQFADVRKWGGHGTVEHHAGRAADGGHSLHLVFPRRFDRHQGPPMDQLASCSRRRRRLHAGGVLA